MSKFEPYKMERAPYPNEFDDGDPRVQPEDLEPFKEQLLRRPPLLNGIELPTVRASREAKHIFHEFGAVMGVGPSADDCEWGHPDQQNWEFLNATHEYGTATVGTVGSMLLFGRHKKDLLIHCVNGSSCSFSIAWGIAILRGADPKESLQALVAAQPLDAYGHEQRVVFPSYRVMQGLLRIFKLGVIPEREEILPIMKDHLLSDPRTDWFDWW